MHGKRLFFIFLAVFSMVATPCPSPLRADQNLSTIVFIFDASGSMWGRLEDKIKIDAAKDVMTRLLSELPAEVSVGLVAYGHRRKGDCADIEMLTAAERGGGAKTAEQVKKLVPKGKTPLAAALSQVGSYLKQQEGEATVVLVSDGIETCGGDPCNVARKLREQGIKVIIHVVGFDVSGAAVDQLQCIADAGGGRYFEADTVASLAAALSAVSEHVTKGTALPQPPLKPVVDAAGAATKRIKVSGPGTLSLAPAPWVRMPPKYWLLVDAETGQEAVRATSDSVRIKPGAYQIVWRQSEHGAGNVKLSEVVNMAGGDKVTVALDTGIRITVPEGMKAPYQWRLVDLEQETVAAFKENLDPQLVPAGSYHLIWRQTEHGHSDVDLGEVVIQPGKLEELVLDCGIVVKLPEWLKPPYYYLLRDDAERQIKIKEVGAQLVPPGVYHLSWKQSAHEYSEIKWGEVAVAEKGFTEVAIDSGLTILAGDSPPPYRIFVQDETGAWAEMADSWGPMPLPPGVYKLEMQATQESSSRVTLVEELPIEKGQLLEIEL